MQSLISRRGDNSNRIIGWFILLLLAVFTVPRLVPSLLSNTITIVDQAPPCDQVRTANNRAVHQSLIGRTAEDPLQLFIETSSMPVQSGQNLVITLTVFNNSIGTVPFIYEPDQILIGDDPNSSGIGIIFDPPSQLSTGINSRRNAGAGTYPESSIRLLGPQQRCLIRLSFTYEQTLQTNIGTVPTTVRGYYRITSAGATQSPPPGQTQIFSDQGLAVIRGGILQSPAVPIPLRATAN